MKVWLGSGGAGSGGAGGLLEADAAGVSVFDHGLTVADGVFETLKVAGGAPVAMSRHLARLDRSAQVLGLPCADHDTIRSAVDDVIGANPEAARLGRLRITLTGGAGPLGSDRMAAHMGAGTTLIIALSAMQPWPDTTSAVVVPWVRNERSAIAGAKSTSYAENVVALAWAKERGFAEGLFLNTVGQVCEGTGTNVFVVIDGEILTPPLASGALAGITRELVLEWCGAREADLSRAELESADEVFVTSSTRDVHSVARLGERSWTDVGPVTARARDEFASGIARQIDP